jgi:hypothetical protein
MLAARRCVLTTSAVRATAFATSTTDATASAVMLSAANASVDGKAGCMPNGSVGARRGDTGRSHGRSYGEPT